MRDRCVANAVPWVLLAMLLAAPSVSADDNECIVSSGDECVVDDETGHYTQVMELIRATPAGCFLQAFQGGGPTYTDCPPLDNLRAEETIECYQGGYTNPVGQQVITGFVQWNGHCLDKDFSTLYPVTETVDGPLDEHGWPLLDRAVAYVFGCADGLLAVDPSRCEELP